MYWSEKNSNIESVGTNLLRKNMFKVFIDIHDEYNNRITNTKNLQVILKYMYNLRTTTKFGIIQRTKFLRIDALSVVCANKEKQYNLSNHIINSELLAEY